MAQLSSTAISPQTFPAAGIVQSNQPSGRSQSPVALTSATSTTNDFCQPPTSLTSKEWIVPPRPKPGRKPATGTPPTKRKAQNRAAQRAFRERRAARVGELEEEIKKIEKEDEEEQTALRAHIEKLEKEIEEYRTSLTFWMQRCRGLEAELAVESAAKEEAMRSSEEVSAPPPLPPRSPQVQSEEEPVQNEPEPMGCGNCSSISNCRCIQEVINMQELYSTTDGIENSSNKRSRSPAHGYPRSKRVKPEPADNLETDFTTTAFPSRQLSSTPSAPVVSTSSSTAIGDPCGFCTDATACVCAEMQAAAANDANATIDRQPHRNDAQDFALEANKEGTTLPPYSSLRPRISQLSHITPPPSDTDAPVPTLSTQHVISSTNNPCINGPGTCFQCRSDPNSTLFCKSLAKSQEQQQQHQTTSLSPQQNGYCRESEISNADCCQPVSQAQPDAVERGGPGMKTRSSKTDASIPAHANSGRGVGAENVEENGKESSQTSIVLTCADAYTTLSRHPGYPRAVEEMGRWLPRLQPAPGTHHKSGRETCSRAKADGEHGGSRDNGSSSDVCVEGRPAMEIDAANVMAVLREFDRRFND
jgi:bZIP transcription factor/Minimal binding motif of Hap4 for binding to Hap2/3/5